MNDVSIETGDHQPLSVVHEVKMAVEISAGSSSTLDPLPEDLRHGLIAVTVLAFVSLISTALLVLYITYRLIKWQRIARQIPQHNVEQLHNACTASDGTNDLSLGLEERHYHYLKKNPHSPTITEPSTPRLEKGPLSITKKDTRWNPVLMLIYNLLCANMMEAMAFLLSIEWLKADGIFVPTAACWAQGWFMQLGKLVCSGMLVLISINTYTTIVRGYKLSRTTIYIATASVWVIAVALPLGSIIGTRNGAGHGGFYTRAGAWCWVNSEYSSLGLWLEYFWIFVAMAVTVVLLVLVLFSLYRHNRSARHFPPIASEPMEPREKSEPPKPSGHHPAFLVYQVIYIICTAPLAISRMTAMTGVKASWTFYGIAGAMIASHGWLNVLLWSTTIIFIGDQDIRDTGLEKFAFIRTPQRTYGNLVVVQGGNDQSQQQRAWWSPWRLPKRSPDTKPAEYHNRKESEESLRKTKSLEHSVIEVEIEATVVIESADNDLTRTGSDKNTENDHQG